MAADEKDLPREATHGPQPDPTEDGRALGLTAAGQLDTKSYSPTGGSSVQNWQAAQVADPSLERQDNVFFAAVEMTRMPMILTNPRLPNNPVVFANKAFLDLTGYE